MFLFDSMQQFVINNIHFHFRSSLPLHEAEVRINCKNENSTLQVKASNGYQLPSVKKSFNITFKQFRELENAIQIFSHSVPDDKALGLDGSHWFLEYDMGDKKKSYEFWSPEIDSKSRGLKEFMHVCMQIFKLAEIEIIEGL